MKRWHLPVAWTGQDYEANVVITEEDGLITSIEPNAAHTDGAVTLAGVSYPGFVNTHSHVFHRLLRGHPGTPRGDFWSWREAMYETAAALDPDSYRAVAAATFREMLAAGYTSVTEFHYLHHQPDGTPYDNPNVMAEAVCEAAAETGIRLTLLDTCYLSGGFGLPPDDTQLRFSDGTAEAWRERISAWTPPSGVEVGAAIHSVRAVDPRQMAVVAAWSGERPLHVHVSEQPDENRLCLEHYERSPSGVLEDAGILGPNVTVVHGTHATPDDIRILSNAGVSASICPTTERWLADGIGPTRAMAEAGIELTIGSDSQAVIDPFEEMRLLELHQRLVTGTTGSHDVSALVRAGTAGRTLEIGGRLDLVVVDPESPRTAGVPTRGVPFAATSADVTTVLVDGRRIDPT